MKINTTLTTLNLRCDDKIGKERNRKREQEEMNNEQGTKQDQKERKQ